MLKAVFGLLLARDRGMAVLRPVDLMLRPLVLPGSGDCGFMLMCFHRHGYVMLQDEVSGAQGWKVLLYVYVAPIACKFDASRGWVNVERVIIKELGQVRGVGFGRSG